MSDQPTTSLQGDGMERLVHESRLACFPQQAAGESWQDYIYRLAKRFHVTFDQAESAIAHVK